MTIAAPPAARALGAAGAVAGVVLLFVFFVQLEQALNPYRLILFSGLVIALLLGLYPRQASVSPRLAAAATGLAVLAFGWFLAMTVLRLAEANPFGSNFGFIAFLSGLALWLGAAGYGAASLAIRAFSRLGPALLVVGSLLAITGIDRLGLTGAGNETVFGPLSLFGIFLHGCGWIVLGVELALRPQPAAG